MSTFGKRLTLAMGVAAGAALAAFAVSKSGKKEIKKWSDKTGNWKDDLMTKVSKDINKIKRDRKVFI